MGFLSSDETRFALASAKANFFGVTVYGIQSYKLTDEVGGEEVYGNGQLPLGLPPGAFKGSGSLGLLPEEADSMLGGIGPGWSQIPGSISLVLIEPNNSNVYTVDAGGVYLRKMEMDFGEPGGNKPSVVTYDLKILQPISWNGLPSVIVPSFLSAPLASVVSIF